MKLIGFANHHEGNVEVSVRPTLLANKHPLAGVKDEYNAVYVNGESVGETMFYGPGAGSLPTATAVMSDVVAVIKNQLLGVNGQRFIKPRFEKVIKAPEQRFGQYYFRLHVKDEVGAFTTISSLFNQLDISFERILQAPIRNGQRDGLAEVIVVTHETSLDKFSRVLEDLQNVDVVKEVQSYFRIEGEMER